jgi:hypothetical protein
VASGEGIRGTVFDFVMKFEGVEFPEAVARVAAERGMAPDGRRNGASNGKHADEWLPILPAPSNAPPPNDKLRCDTLHEYRDADGAPLCYVRRIEATARDGKRFLPLTYGVLNGQKGWHDKAPDQPRPLYRLDALAQWPGDATVLLCEGEKAANAAGNLFPDYVAMSWMGGANAVTTADLSPLKGHKVIIWPDADEPGRTAAGQLAALLPDARIVGTEGLPEGFDAADLERIGEADPDAWLQDRLPDPLAALGIRNAGEYAYEKIAPREWLLGTIFCKKFLSSLIAPGAVGKTALRIVQAAAFVTGRPITGEHVHRTGRALILSFEDDEEELGRRIYAMLRRHGITPEDVDGRLFFAAPKGPKLAKVVNRSPEAAELVGLLRRAITTLQLHLVVLDPFIKTHSVDENDNGAMDFVCDLLAAIAIDLNCAIDFLHHTSKGPASAGDANRGRGASSSKDAGRLVYTLTPMALGEAEMFGIPEESRRSLVRMDSAKVNIAPASAEAKWFRLVGEKLGNGTDAYPNGDEVQTVEPWTPPNMWDGLDHFVLNRILDVLDRGLDNGQRYSDANAADKRAAWRAVEAQAGRTERQSKAIIAAWIKSGTLFRQDYKDPTDHKVRTGLYVDATKRPGGRNCQ